MGYLTQPPEIIADFVPQVCPFGKDSKAKSSKPKCAGDEAEPGSGKYFA